MAKATPLHSKIGASTCERWWNCPGSVALVAQCPPQKSSVFADEGTVAHLVGEWGLRTGRDAVEFVGSKAIQIKTKEGEVKFEFKEDIRTFKGAVKTGVEIEVTDEMAEAVQMYLDTIRFDMASYNLGIEDIKIEHRFHLKNIDENAYGTNDCNLPVFLDRVIVYDYKHGQGIAVDAEENKQLMYYALGAAELGDYETIEVVIVQPRAVHRDGPVRRWTISRSDLAAFGEELKNRIASTRRADAEVNAGSWCKKSFCPAMAACPAIRGVVAREATLVFDKPVMGLPRPETLSPEMLRNILDAMPMAEAWLTSVWAYAEQKANNGEKILGYKLVQGREGNRKWKDEALVIKDLIKEVENPNDLYERKLVSPAQVEKLIGKSKEKRAIVDNLITRSEGKIIMVPENDPRTGVQPNATQVFLVEEFDIFN